MSITLDDFDVDPQTKPVVRVALERTRVSLGLTDDLADGIIAKQIIELAKAGERNPDLLVPKSRPISLNLFSSSAEISPQAAMTCPTTLKASLRV
jgi:hypothetical protein